MSFLELAKKRYSVRNYEDKQVEKEKIEKILEAARVAPSAHNLQPTRLIVVQEEKGLEKISKAAKIYGAPMAIIITGDRDTAWVRTYDSKNHLDIDATVMSVHMLLEATELGLGTLYVCNFDPAIIRKEFKLPENIVPINILAIGYSAAKVQSPDRHDDTRKPLQEIVVHESY